MAAKSPPLPMMPMFVRDYLSATRGMTLAERGAYSDLLFFNWEMGTLPADPKRLALLLGVSVDELMAVWPVMRLKFERTPDGTGLVNARLERERSKSLSMRTKASEKAAYAAGKRWGNDASSNPPSNASSNAPSMNGAQVESQNERRALQ